MKIFSLFKWFLSFILVGGGIAAIVNFSDFNTKRFPTVKILTRENYQAIKQAQISNKSGVDINYSTLPSSNYSTYDVASGIKQNYMFFFGSEAYSETTKALYGWNNNFASSQNTPISKKNSLMLTLYDLFLTDNEDAITYGVENVNPIFLNYIDVCSTKEINNSQKLFYERMYSMGDAFPDDSDVPVVDKSNQWIINKGDANEKRENVVNGATSYNYNPEESYYEFRPNNLADTEYEKVYFRNQNIVKSWLDIANFLSNYLSSKNAVSFSKTGTLLCVKYENNSWSFKTLTSFSEKVNDDVIQIVKFYNPEYKDETNDDSESSQTPESPPAATYSLAHQMNNSNLYTLNKVYKQENIALLKQKNKII